MRSHILITMLFSTVFLASPFNAKAEMDGGVSPDGIPVICSETMALRCGLGSEDAGDEAKIKTCLDTIAADSYGSALVKENVHELRRKILQECASVYSSLAAKYKSQAGNYQANSIESGDYDNPTDQSGKSAQENKMIGNNSKSIIRLTDLYASSLSMNSLESYFGSMSTRQISDEAKEHGVAPAEMISDTATGGGDE